MENKIEIGIICPANSHAETKLNAQTLANGLKSSLTNLLHRPVEVFQYLSSEIDKIEKDFFLIIPGFENLASLSPTFLDKNKEKTLLIFTEENEKKTINKSFEELKYFDFFDIDLKFNRLRIYDPEIQGNETRLFWLKVLDIAFEIASSFNKKEFQNNIYIAEHSKDVSEYCDALIRNLKSIEYTIVPDKKLKPFYEDTKSFENNLLNIFITGNRVSNLEWQKEVERSISQTKVKTIVWIPYGMKIEDKPLIELFENIQNNHKQHAQVLQMPFDDLLRLVYEKLEIGDIKENKPVKTDFNQSLYIIHDVKDTQKVETLSSELKKQNINPLYIDFDIKNLNTIEEHREFLSKADAVLIFDNNCTDRWIDSKLKDLIKSPGYGRMKPLKTKAILTQTPDKIKSKKHIDQTFQIATMTEGLNKLDFNIN